MAARMKTYATFNLWAADQSPKHRRIISALRKIVKKAAPKLTEIVKWGNGCYAGERQPVIYIHTEDDHVQFGYFAGAKLLDPQGRLEGSGKFVRHIKIRTAKDIDDAYFSRLIRQAVKLERGD